MNQAGGTVLPMIPEHQAGILPHNGLEEDRHTGPEVGERCQLPPTLTYPDSMGKQIDDIGDK